ncbi:helix-turn-helix domain-containing protein [Glycomyces tenuis]|uniref:helix-turn-helix domain-containing protein n=1 Tax=Glycomyces tenuis TaxID=58116 RepID=UPI0024A81823|nr:transposase family protein [Glycomyces tenuis]
MGQERSSCRTTAVYFRCPPGASNAAAPRPPCPSRAVPRASPPGSSVPTRTTIGSRWRVLEPGQQALPTFAYLHQGHTYEQLALGFGVSRATAARRVNEVIDLLRSMR